MKPLALQNVALALGDLRDDLAYKAMEPSGSPAFHRLRQEVEMAATRCFTLAPDTPTQDEIAERLDRMLGSCEGDLAQFRPFIEKAQEALVA